MKCDSMLRSCNGNDRVITISNHECFMIGVIFDKLHIGFWSMKCHELVLVCVPILHSSIPKTQKPARKDVKFYCDWSFEMWNITGNFSDNFVVITSSWWLYDGDTQHNMHGKLLVESALGKRESREKISLNDLISVLANRKGFSVYWIIQESCNITIP